METHKRDILVPLIDDIKKKNMHQFRGLARHGYSFTVLTTDQTGNSLAVVADEPGIELHVCVPQSSRIKYLRQLIDVMCSRKFMLAELYPDSYLQLLIALVLKAFRVQILIIARGAELAYVMGELPWLRALAFRLTYALGDAVIYKEVYMTQMLEDMHKESVFFLPNSIEMPEPVTVDGRDRCRFLFLNTFKPFRHPELIVAAFLKLLRDPDIQRCEGIQLDIVGLIGENASATIAAKEAYVRRVVEEAGAPIGLHPWTNESSTWMNDADVFLLPSDLVFLNYALLEAMGRGIPSIVSASQGSDLIVENGVNGFVLPRDVDVWGDHMKLLCLRPELRKSLGSCARQTVALRYSYESYINRYMHIYDRVTGIDNNSGSDGHAAYLLSAPGLPASNAPANPAHKIN